MKKNEIRTKRKQTREADATEADALIKDFLTRNYFHNAKTEALLKEYLDSKNHPYSSESEVGSDD